MITATVLKNSNNYISFSCEGHAGYARKGSDIVCAAVSMLTINAANSINELTDTKIDIVIDEKSGFASWQFTDETDEKVRLLMDSLVLGLQSIRDNYKKYLTLKIEEV